MIKPVEMLTLDFMEDVLVFFWHIKGTRLLLNSRTVCSHRGAPVQEMLHSSLGRSKQAEVSWDTQGQRDPVWQRYAEGGQGELGASPGRAHHLVSLAG